MDKSNETTFSKEVKDHTKDRISIEIGDSKKPDFKPQFKLMRWDNEVNFSIRAEEHPDAVVETEGEKIKYITPDYEVHQYEKPEAGEDGGFEFEWVLNSKPASNILSTTIQSKGLDFFYQPELTDKEIEQGLFRPENVVGSYAVYHSTKGGMNDSRGMEYKTGKFCHIYRPKAIDADNKETWCDLNISDGILTVTVPEKFLDEAVYPVVVDPVFGYASAGATGWSIENVFVSTQFNLPNNGTITKITARGVSSTVDKNSTAGVYNSSGDLITNGTTVEVSMTQASGEIWRDYTMLISPTTPSGNYFLGFWSASASGASFALYDTDAAVTNATVSATYSSTLSTPLTISDVDRKVSIYATYTNADPGTYTDVYSTPGSYTFTVPTGVTSIDVALWGGGGSGASVNGSGGGGGGGGAYAKSTLSVTPGATHTIVVGAGGALAVSNANGNAGTDSTFGTTTVVADAGAGASTTTGGAGGTTGGSTGDVEFAGGTGGNGTTSGDQGGGGGGSAGKDGAGAAGTNANGTTSGSGGNGDNSSGGAGGAGVTSGAANPGTSNVLGGGGGGGAVDTLGGAAAGEPAAGSGGGEAAGQRGGNGRAEITYTIPATGIAFDAASNSGEQLAQSTYSWNHTCTGSDRYLTVKIGMLSLAQTVSGITYNSVPMTFLGAQNSVSGAARIELWGLVAPSTGSNSIAVTITGAINSGGVAASYTGVHQTSPTEGFNSAQATNVGAADATVNVTTVADNDWVVDAVVTDDTTITVGAGQTQRNNISGTVGATADSDEGPKTPAGSVTMSWTGIGALATWSIGAIALRPTAASSLVTDPFINNKFFQLLGVGT